MEKSKVYFTKEITPESLIKMYETLGVKLNDPIKIGLSGETMNNTKNNNITITNHMNITGSNAKEIANTIKDTQDKMLMDNVALQLN